jgi:hypothetical protein
MFRSPKRSWTRTGVGLSGLLLLLGSAGGAQAGFITVVRTVDSHQGPWQFVPGGLNDAYRFGFNDHLAPLVVDASDGFDFTSGGTFTVTYLGGATSALPPLFGYSDARGHTNWPQYGSGTPGTSGAFFPSVYMDRSEYPVYLNALVGTFADDAGRIVGTPFAVNLGRTLVVPTGATRLQLGINDDIFYDNDGALTVSITGPAAVPEPSTLGSSAVAALLFVGYGLYRRMRLRLVPSAG